MAYKALYRTYRPQNFGQVVGQEMVVRTLENSIINNKISHAYLFCGPRGTGKTTIARIFAKALNCGNKQNYEPCNECALCQEITSGVSPDVIEIDAASNNGVDEMRDLKDKVKFLPGGAKYKIYIIDEVHMLSTSAFNALLKTLEEPPAHAIFILATTEPHKVLPTIVSRCQRYDFKSLTPQEIIFNIKNICDKENISYTDEALRIIASASEGGMRDALSFLDQAISLSDQIVDEKVASTVTGLLDKNTLFNLATYLENKQISESLESIESLQNSGKEVSKIIAGLIKFYRDVLVAKAGINNDYDDEFLDFSKKIDIKKVYYYIDILSDVQNKVKFNTSANIFLEVAIIKIINASSNDLDFNKRLLELEEKMDNYSPSETSFGFDNNEVKRIKILEEKFNNLLVELSKLDLIGLIEKVKKLETNSNASIDITSVKEVNNKVDKIVEDIELLKVIQGGIRTELDNVSLGGIDESVLDNKIESNLKKLKPAINYSEIDSYVKKQIENIDVNFNNEKLEKRIIEVEQNVNNVLNNKNDNVTIDIPEDIIKRIENLENKNDNISFNENIHNTSVNNENVHLLKDQFMILEDKVNDYEDKVNGYEDKVNVLEDKVNGYEDKVNILEDKLNNFEDKVNILEDKQSDEANNQIDIINERLEQLENKKDATQDFEKIKELEEKIAEISISKKSSSNISLDNYEDRINKMESNIYKIMSGMLKPVSTKKNKSKVDDKQISLWRDDIIDVNKINNPNGNSKTDFGDFALNEEIKEVVQKDVNETITENNNDSAITFDKEQNINQENVSENIFEENLEDFYDDSKEDTPVSINYSNSNNFFEEPKEEYSDFENNKIIEEERLRQEQIKKEKIEQERLAQEKIERERLEQERLAQEQIKQERLAQEEKKRQEQIELNKRKLEEQRVKEELERQRKLEEERILMEQKRQDNLGYDSSNDDLDEYERYDVKVLERIMNDARNPEYATERERILNLWKHLIALAPADKRGVAEILVEGQVKAVGNHEFVIIYNQSAICNQVMSRKFKRVSLKLLFDLLGGDYNYFAITNEVWFMKRTEYSEQYSIGTKYPTLTPIDDPRLKVNNDLERDETEEAIKQMHDIFGSSINIKKRG